MTDQIATEPMPEWAAIRYADSMRRATTNARKPWMHLFTWDEVHSFVGEIAVQVWQTWEAPYVRSPERYATTDLKQKTLNRLAAEARRLGWSQKRQPDGTRKWAAPPRSENLLTGDNPSPAADTWIDGQPLSPEERRERLAFLIRELERLNVKVEKLPEPRWEQFSEWVKRYEYIRNVEFARQVAEKALARYAFEVMRAEDLAA